MADISGYRFLLLALILAFNGFFAAAEVSLLSSRRSRLSHLAARGNLGAQAALQLLQNPERLLSVVQVGVTLASLGLGWAGEDTLYRLALHQLGPVLDPVGRTTLHVASFTIAFSVMTYAHVVLGEVVPKHIALEKAERLAILVSPLLLVFYRASEPFVLVIERSASLVNRLIGLKGASHGGGHSAEELKYIIATSRTAGHLEPFEEATITRLLGLREYAAREIMVPRNQIVSVPLNSTLDQVLQTFIEHQYSRLPVYHKAPENIIGMVHYKDLIQVWNERRKALEQNRAARPFQLRRILRRTLVVPETKPVVELIEEFRRQHTHMAMVVDEFGTISGLITFEDVLEQIFGEIEDEHDERRAGIRREAEILELDGSTPVVDLERDYGIVLPSEAGFETLAGFLLYQLGRIPEPGASVEYNGRRYTVTEMERNRIAQVRIELLPDAAPDSPAPSPKPKPGITVQ
jgi:CBS domain containing-hemolysin-like protein